MATTIKVPDIGDFDAVEIIDVLVSPGDVLEAEQAILVLESDKATMEIPCPVAGKLLRLAVKTGDKVTEGDVIGEIESGESGETAGSEAKQQTDPETNAQSEQLTEPPDRTPREAQHTPAPKAPRDEAAEPETAHQASPGQLPHASPGVRLFARELGVRLNQIKGSGPKGRILKQDVQEHVKQRLAKPESQVDGPALPSMPDIDFSRFGQTETKALPRIRKISAQNLHRNWLLIPHVTQFESADITDLESFRKAESARLGLKLTLLPFVLKACSLVLREYPEFNSSLASDGASLILKKYCHIGFAAETPQGLVVPVIRDVDQKSVRQLADEAAGLAARAREGKLSPGEMQGGCFSVSSLGGIGGSHFTPIVNAPEVAILGVSRAKQEAVWDGQGFQPRLILPLSLSYDHRVIDGAAAARFAVRISELLSDVRRLCL